MDDIGQAVMRFNTRVRPSRTIPGHAQVRAIVAASGGDEALVLLLGT